ncbi:uncharacterized protein [Eschrichtius robustus]|uniref:uncharacterized protein n=1 Tax=Eschrichtius robustus TaxID=9764 RepID=UPI0035C118A8
MARRARDGNKGRGQEGGAARPVARRGGRRVCPARAGRSPRRRLSGRVPSPFQPPAPPSHSGEAKLCTSIESGLQSRGRRAARRGGRGRPAPFPGVGPLRPRTNQLGFPWTPGTQGVPTPTEKKSEREKGRGEGTLARGLAYPSCGTCRVGARRWPGVHLPHPRAPGMAREAVRAETETWEQRVSKLTGGRGKMRWIGRNGRLPETLTLPTA